VGELIVCPPTHETKSNTWCTETQEAMTANSKEESTEQCVKQFATDGFLVLRGRIPVDSNLEQWQLFATEYFQKIFVDLQSTGHTKFPTHVIVDEKNEGERKREYALGLGVKFGFREIVMRLPDVMKYLC
jgi:hypothetical protein